VLGIDQQPVKPGAGNHLGAVGTHEGTPQTNLPLFGEDGALECIEGQVHGVSLIAMGNRTAERLERPDILGPLWAHGLTEAPERQSWIALPGLHSFH
jgi:hypothetical protein